MLNLWRDRAGEQSSVVITGASSGIGRATALEFARRGAKLTLVSRRAGELDQLAKECLRLGASGAQAEAADVADGAALRRAANSAIRRFGRVDVWVNNAGVGAVGRFTDTPLAAHERVIRTNLLGYVNGAYAVLPHFQQRRRGILINVISFGAFVATPFAASYAASKYGLRGFSESLRAELSGYRDIHVCDVHPGFVDTPGIQNAANYTGHALRPTPPDRPEEVADAIVRLASRPREVVHVGAVSKLAPLGYALAPKLGRWAVTRAMQVGLARTPPTASGPGGLFRPVRGRPAAVRGGLGAGSRTEAAAGRPATTARKPMAASTSRTERGSGSVIARVLGYGILAAAAAALAAAAPSLRGSAGPSAQEE